MANMEIMTNELMHFTGSTPLRTDLARPELKRITVLGIDASRRVRTVHHLGSRSALPTPRT